MLEDLPFDAFDLLIESFRKGAWRFHGTGSELHNQYLQANGGQVTSVSIKKEKLLEKLRENLGYFEFFTSQPKEAE